MIVIYCVDCDKVKYEGAVASQKKCSICALMLYRVVIGKELQEAK